ncbi:MAG: hypothetical protein K8R59_13210 [Thermoanaerobaculales bacterium]|nr:hypothetical protein [Thermoanaerobaculales bacterium]
MWLFFLVGAGVLQAGEASDAALELRVSGETFEVGDPIAVRVQARGGEGSLWGDLSLQTQDQDSWAIITPPREVPGAEPPAWEVVLAPLKIGAMELPILVAGLRDDEGEVLEILSNEGPSITVATVLAADDDGAPAPLHDPVGVHGFPWEWVLPLFLLLAPLVAVAALWWRRRRRAGADVLEAGALPPFEELQQLLEDLRARVGLLSAPEVCDRLAGGVRRYLERRTGEPAAEMTSHELRLLARRSNWPSEIQASLQSVTGVADGVRFGRRGVGDAELIAARETTLDVGRHLERHLMPEPESGGKP